MNLQASPTVTCPHCDSLNLGHVPTVSSERGQVLRYRCNDCGLRFASLVEIDLSTPEIERTLRRLPYDAA